MTNLSVSPRLPAHPVGLSDVWCELDTCVNRDSVDANVRLGVLLTAVGRRSYGPLLLMLGLFAISPATILPGMTTIVAVITLLIAGQMGLGLKRPWLPRAALNIKVPRGIFFAFLDKTRPTVDRIEADWLRPRWEFLSAPPFVNLVALCVIAAALITLPLSLIPFAPLAPGMAVVLFGLGMTARDGVWLSLGLLFTAAGLWFALPIIL